MADKKISALTPSTTPLTGAEVLPIVQSGSTVKVSVADLTAGRAVAATSVTTGLGAVGTPAYTFSGDTNTGIYSPTADTIAFVEGGVESMRIDSSGNVGIGAVPLGFTPLYLYRSGSDAGLRAERASGAALDMFATASTAYFGTATNHPLIFQTNGSERARIDSSGNVGIGTSAPGSRLHIFNSSGNTQARIYTPTGTSASLEFSSDTYNYINAVGGAVLGVQVGGTERMRIDSSGNVGIGTAAPATTLDVATGFIQLSSGATARSKLFADASVSTLTAEGARSLVFATNGAERARIDSSGNVGIGTSAPNASALLDVQSTTKGFRLPNMTTTQKNAISSPAAGLMVFDTTLAKACVYSGSAWQTITSV